MKVSNKDLATEALAELPKGSYGGFVDEKEIEKGAIDVRFECSMRGYEGWVWVVTLTQPDKRKQAMVAELNLMAGENAVLAPDWVPWAERLAQFRAELKEAGKAKSDAEADQLIADMASALSDHDQSDDAEQDSDSSSVQPPLKTRVRQRRIKREQDYEEQDPDEGSN
ncbi:MAG TPA: DUF3027 domain-containing protein [Aquiluna sp.]